jgi:predicted Zn-dependent protease
VRTGFVASIFDRKEEIEADETGVELMFKAGFSLRKGLKAIDKMKGKGLDYSSFEGKGGTIRPGTSG